MGPRAGLDGYGKSRPHRDSIQPVASRYTDYAIPAPAMPVRYLCCISYIKLTCHSVTALHTLHISHLSILVAFIDLQWLRRLTADHSPRRSDFNLELSHVRLDVYKVAVGEVFVDVLLFFPPSIIPLNVT